MTHSRRKTPIFGIAMAESDKPFKAAEHRRERRAVRRKVRDEEAEIAAPKAFGNPWAAPKDGKRYWRKASPEAMRK